MTTPSPIMASPLGTALGRGVASRGKLFADLVIVVGVVSVVVGLVTYALQVGAPFAAKTTIDLSWSALPRYTFFSLCRGVAAYGVSLAFTLVFATAAARSRRAERVLLPILDVLQSIPVLGFLPGLVIGMAALFPAHELGLEIACIIMIFTGQAWNMTFSYYASLKGIPPQLGEVARLHGFSRWRTFRTLELPAAMIGLVWNSMMSMAGGWFFLTVNEAFTLGAKDFRLPGVGSYMAEAIRQGDTSAMLAGIAAMVLMIVAVDQLFWRPVVVWSQRFKLEDTADAEPPHSWFLSLLGRSRLARWLATRRRARRAQARPRAPRTRAATPPSRLHPWARVARVVRWVLVLAALALVLRGAYALVLLLVELPLAAPQGGEDWAHVGLAVGATLLRTTAAVFLGALWALPAGILIGLSPKWSQRLQPVVQVVASFPAPMVFPLVVLVVRALGIPFDIGCVALMLLGAQWYILFNVIAGASAIPGDLKEVGRVFRLSRWRRWRRLYLPAVFPALVTGLVTASGGAWNASIVSEYVQVEGHTYRAFGLGSLIHDATDHGNFPLLAAGVLAMATSVVLINRLVWRRLFRLAERKFSLSL